MRIGVDHVGPTVLRRFLVVLLEVARVSFVVHLWNDGGRHLLARHRIPVDVSEKLVSLHVECAILQVSKAPSAIYRRSARAKRCDGRGAEADLQREAS